VQRIFHLMGCRCWGYAEEEIAPTNNNGGNEMNYEILSNARKQEIDSLRASHITYQLYPTSLTLEKKHMLRRISDTDSPPPATAQNNDSPIPQDRNLNPGESTNKNSDDDVETGFVRGIMDPPENDVEEENKEEEEDDVIYTHVSIPPPGHNFDGVDLSIEKKQPCTEDDKNKPNKEEKKPKNRIFGAKGNKGDNTNDAKEIPSNTTKDDNDKGERKRRECPIFCAICLMEYEATERISWSSNHDCTHVFHEDCIVQWLVSLGRTKSKRQPFSEDPTEAQLFNYPLECPCCRQDFVSRGQSDLSDVCGEESV